ncbi:hypothetical protein JCM8547_004204 [Rhodosporidiobolus lusitaniae]
MSSSSRFVPLARSLFPSSHNRSEQSPAADWTRREHEWAEEKKDARREYREAMDEVMERVMQTTAGDVYVEDLRGGVVVDPPLKARLRRSVLSLGAIDFEEKFSELSPSAVKRALSRYAEEISAESDQLARQKHERSAQNEQRAFPHGADSHNPAEPPQMQLLQVELNYRTLRFWTTAGLLEDFLRYPVDKKSLEIELHEIDERQAERKAAREERERERRAREAEAGGSA